MVRRKSRGAYPNRVKQIRIEAGLSQAELARRTGIHHSNIWHIENGYFVPSDLTRRTISRVLRRAVDDVFPTTWVMR